MAERKKSRRLRLFPESSFENGDPMISARLLTDGCYHPAEDGFSYKCGPHMLFVMACRKKEPVIVLRNEKYTEGIALTTQEGV